MSSTRETALAYYAAVGDLTGDESVLEGLLHPAARVVEHPNLISPQGAELDREQALANLRKGRDLLSEQRFDVHEVLVDGDRAAVRATWHGVTGADRGPLPAGTRLRAEVSGWMTVQDGKVLEHETFDCYPPFAEYAATAARPSSAARS